MVQPPSVEDILRYRYHHGVNLGSCFVLERWLFPSMFLDGTDGDSELAAVRDSVEMVGFQETAAKWEHHWQSFLSDLECDYLANVLRVTTVRLPVGYFTLGPRFCENTPFQPFTEVYHGAWEAVRQLVSRLASRGIGTLLDLHASAGGANTGSHSGTDIQRAGLWRSQWYRRLMRECVVFMTDEARSMPGVVGVQICNEAQRGAPNMWNLYKDVMNCAAEISPGMPLYLSDAWELERGLKFVREHNDVNIAGAGSRCPAVLDTHAYWCFTEQHKARTPEQIIQENVPAFLSDIRNRQGLVCEKGASGVIIGEWSCAVTPAPNSTLENHDAIMKRFGQAQERAWRTRTGGHFFWTAKMESMDGGGWDFGAMCDKGAIPVPEWLRLSDEEVREAIAAATERNEWLKRQSLRIHSSQRDRESPGTHFDRAQYETGWNVGFSDATAFFAFRTLNSGSAGNVGADMIGHLDLWIRKRMLDAGIMGSGAWEFETGLRQAVTTFEKYAFTI